MHALRLNIARRHLNTEQKRVVIGDVLKRHPEWSNNVIAGLISVSDMTVASVRSALEATSQIRKLERTVGKDGKSRTTTPKARAPKTTSISLPGDGGGRRGREGEWA